MTDDQDGTRCRYWTYFAVLAAVYFLGYGWFLAHTDFLPYVLDNNESFSAFIHGKNLYEYDFFRSFGLADESLGAVAAAHPYVYTHQGNFPRIFTFLLYALGARSVESQIVISTMTVGLLTVFLIYRFFALTVNPLFALIVSLVLISDYLLFAQWQVNTFKVWHGFFIFAALVCVQRYQEHHSSSRAVMLVATHAAVFYFDIMMAVFTFTASAMYVVIAYRDRGAKRIFKTLFLQAVGSAASLIVFFMQLLGYYGWSGLKQDIYLTFFSRNASGSLKLDESVLEKFFADNKIVFWSNYIDASPYFNVTAFIKSIFGYGFSVYTPLFTLIIFMLFCAWIIPLYRDAIARRFSFLEGLPLRAKIALMFGVCAMALAFAAPLWPSKILLPVIQALFIALVIFPAIVRNRFFLRRVARALAMLRRNRVVVVLALLLMENLFLLYPSASPVIWGKHSPEQVFFLITYAVVLAATLYLLLADKENSGSTGKTRATTTPYAAIFELFRELPRLCLDFLIVFFLAFFIVLAIFSFRFESLPGWNKLFVGLVQGERIIAYFVITILLATGAALAWVAGVGRIVFNFQAERLGLWRPWTVKDKWLVTGLFAIMSAFGWMHWRLYHLKTADLSPIWNYVILNTQLSWGTPKLMLVLAAIVSCMAITLRRSEGQSRFEYRAAQGVIYFLLSMLLGYAVAYLLFPGYVMVINLHRYSPLLVFLMAPILALALYAVLRITNRAWRLFMDAWLNYRAGHSSTFMFGGALSVLLVPLSMVVTLMFYWTSLQSSYFQLLPPHAASYLRKLDSEPYRGASFVSSTYATPVTAKTGNWAYLDPLFVGVGEYEFGAKGYVRKSSSTYLWFADRDHPRYQYPDYAVCHIMPSMVDALTRIDLFAKLKLPGAHISDIDAPSGEIYRSLGPALPDRIGCGGLNVPYFADQAKGGDIRFTLVDRDPSILYRWAIVKLEDDFMPYLAPLDQVRGEHIRLDVVSRGKERELRLTYSYRQQQGKAESGSRMTVKFVPASGVRGSFTDVQTIYDGPARSEIGLPAGISGFVYATITPQSISRAGKSYVSTPVWIEMVRR